MVCERRHGSRKVIKNIGCSSRPEGKSVLLNQDKDNNKLLLIYRVLLLVLCIVKAIWCFHLEEVASRNIHLRCFAFATMTSLLRCICVFA